MPRALKPETAAKRIVGLISKGEAISADDAITQHPELMVGKELLQQAIEGSSPTSATPAAPPATPKVRATGSGPALLSR